MQKKVSKIENTEYGQDSVCCEPSKADIQKAVDEKDFESRRFQEDFYELIAEWEAASKPERYERMRKYHAKRIAFFVVNGWDGPIVLNTDEHKIKEGLHRLKAAIFLGWKLWKLTWHDKRRIRQTFPRRKRADNRGAWHSTRKFARSCRESSYCRQGRAVNLTMLRNALWLAFAGALSFAQTMIFGWKRAKSLGRDGGMLRASPFG